MDIMTLPGDILNKRTALMQGVRVGNNKNFQAPCCLPTTNSGIRRPRHGRNRQQWRERGHNRNCRQKKERPQNVKPTVITEFACGERKRPNNKTPTQREKLRKLREITHSTLIINTRKLVCTSSLCTERVLGKKGYGQDQGSRARDHHKEARVIQGSITIYLTTEHL